MKEKRTSGVWVVAVMAVLVLLPLVAYVAGYFVLSDSGSMSFIVHEDGSKSLEYRPRFYARRWLATIYSPAGRVEKLLTGVEVRVRCKHDEDGPIVPR